MNLNKVLFIYPSKPLAEERLKTYASWKKLGVELEVLFAFDEQYEMSLLDRILHKIKLPRDINNLNKRIKQACLNFKPDLVFIVKGVLVKPDTLKFIKKLGIKSVSWSNDDMFAWHNRSLWYTWSLKHYDLVVTQKSYNCNTDELPSLGATVLFQDKAIDPITNYKIEDCSKFNYVHECLVICSKDLDRLDHLIYLAENGVQVHIYGWGTNDVGKYHDNLVFHNKHVYGEDFKAALGCSKMSLNFLRKMNRDLQTSRSIEIPAARGFMLAERTIEHERLFIEGKEAEYFSSKEELLKKVEYYLEHDNDRIQIAQNGYDKCYSADYTFENRIKEIIQKVLHE